MAYRGLGTSCTVEHLVAGSAIDSRQTTEARPAVSGTFSFSTARHPSHEVKHSTFDQHRGFKLNPLTASARTPPSSSCCNTTLNLPKGLITLRSSRVTSTEATCRHQLSEPRCPSGLTIRRGSWEIDATKTLWLPYEPVRMVVARLSCHDDARENRITSGVGDSRTILDC